MSRFLSEPQGDGSILDGVGTEEHEHRPRWASWVAVIISLAVLVGGGLFIYQKVSDSFRFNTSADYDGPGSGEVTVTIPWGATVTDMAESLVEADVVASTNAFIKAAQANPDSSGIQAGSYVMKKRMKASEALGLLISRETMVSSMVTVREGLRNTSVVSAIAEQTGMSAEDLDAALADAAALRLPDWSRGGSEGFLFPDTYSYDPNTTASQLLAKMTAQFEQVTTDIDFVNQANARGIDPRDALIVASIIEKEVNNPVYANDVAQVLYNRLADGMKLQLDSTVIYAVGSEGTITTTDEQRATDSPYNTYVHEGLPAGPISNPGKWALEAAVNPTSGEYLYFVAVNPDTGETKFATDWAGHEANVAEFQAWCRANADRCS